MKRYYIAMILLVFISAATITAHYLVTRPVIADEQRTNDIVQLQVATNNYHNSHNSLPDALSQLELSDTDLRTRLGNYNYTKATASTYEICATFQTNASTSSRVEEDRATESPYTHKQGYQCFKTTLGQTETTHPIIDYNLNSYR